MSDILATKNSESPTSPIPMPFVFNLSLLAIVSHIFLVVWLSKTLTKSLRDLIPLMRRK